ncbi:MAG: hypothetical protein K2G26_02145, partial [Clostridia bacterium]|nr:hypothetical protein [Clostridia bacterium]
LRSILAAIEESKRKKGGHSLKGRD